MLTFCSHHAVFGTRLARPAEVGVPKRQNIFSILSNLLDKEFQTQRNIQSTQMEIEYNLVFFQIWCRVQNINVKKLKNKLLFCESRYSWNYNLVLRYNSVSNTEGFEALQDMSWLMTVRWEVSFHTLLTEINTCGCWTLDAVPSRSFNGVYSTYITLMTKYENNKY